ncbi:MAG TPA: bacillithiol biosynthesis cysteine-adding enzyme BshC [Longimicrobiales bacterium]|nr:bacillithiol biosynthesis cysteine-adding enzyme BshC [Longimicrobiales bacterium]
MSFVLPETSLNLEILAGPLQGGGPLVRDYLAGAQALAPFYSGHPGDLAAYRRKATEVDARLDGVARAQVAAAIVPLGDAAQHLSRILAGDGYFVTTGQQPALFGGPLYTLYKVLGSIRLAEVLERQLGRPVLALFWIGADDHDWAEANHASLLDSQHYVHRLTVRGDPKAPPIPLSERTWGPGVDSVVDEFVSLLPPSEFRDDVVAHVRAAYTPGSTVAASFTATMELLLRGRRVAMVSSAHPAVRQTAAPVLLREVEGAAAHAAALHRQTARLEAAGYAPQVQLADEASNIMLLGPDGRDRIMRDGDGWRTRRERHGLPGEKLQQMIGAEPDRFSPNVLLRPVVESAVFPTVAYVAGPGELSYFAQLGCLFEAHGILQPVVVARPSVTLVDAKMRRLLGRIGLEPEGVRRPYQELLTEVVRREIPPAAGNALERIRRVLHESYGELMELTAEIDPTLRGPLTAARNWSTVRANEAEKRIVRHMKRRNAILVEQVRKVSASLHPDGAPQERVLSPLPLLARHGPELVAAVEAALDLTPVPVAQWHGPECGGRGG